MKKIYLFIGLVFSATVFSQDKVRQIDSLVKASHMKKQFFGNILVAEKGKIIYRESFGVANEATGAKLDSNSIFELASVSKQFTAMGIMLLKKQGKLSYEDSLRKFFPELPYSGVTIWHLIHHTSGLPDYMEPVMKAMKDKIATNTDMIRVLAQEKLPVLFQPGEKWEYSNTGYALLASIIEKVSGKSFPEFLKKNIFDPVGMTHTSVFRRRYENKSLPNYAYGYGFDKKNNKYILPDEDPEIAPMVKILDGIMGDGTVNSPTGDLYKWDRALYTEKLVPQSMIGELYKPAVLNNGEKTSYGFGVMITDYKNMGKVISHSGGWPGYATLVERHIDNDKTIIILRNHDAPVQVLQKIRDILYEVKPETRTEIKLDSAILKEYVGEYELAPGFTITVTMDKDKIFAQATGQQKFEIFAEKKDWLFLKVVEAKMEFKRDEKGMVNSLVLYQAGQEVPGPKIK